MMGMMDMMSGGMMDMSLMAFRPGALLQSAETLELSDDQKARLQALAESGQEEHGQHAMAAHQQAGSTLGSDAPDLDAYAEALQSAVSHMAMAHVAMTRTALDARGLLDRPRGVLSVWCLRGTGLLPDLQRALETPGY